MKNKKIGLTLGKYAPFHKGHQLVIDQSLEEMDKVIVVIYNASETTNIPLKRRASWIRKIYPQVKVIEAKDGPTEIGDTPEIKKKHEDYLIKDLKLKGIDAFYSGEFYGDHISKAFKAKNVQVDPDRKKIPISGTLIRKNPYKYRYFLHPIVYKDLVTNVAFLGAPSTGKTSIASKMAEEFDTQWMPEYGREYWEKNQVNRRLSPEQLVHIAQKHIEIEDKKLLQSNKYLFTDTNAITTYTFALDYHGYAKKPLKMLSENAKYRYHVTFLCDTDISYDDTWDRSGEVKREKFQEMLIEYLNSQEIDYYLISGSLKKRVKKVKKILSGIDVK